MCWVIMELSGTICVTLGKWQLLWASIGKMEGDKSNDFKAAHSTLVIFICSSRSFKIYRLEGFTTLTFILGVEEMAFKNQPLNNPELL